MKSQLLVCGAKQIIYLSGCSCVTLTVHPILLYSSHLQNACHISIIHLVNNVIHLCGEFLFQIVEVYLR
jgi:hypothetical protein